MVLANQPNWPFGYVPPAEEWASQWASKADCPVPVGQGGTGATSAQDANYGLQQRGLIAATMTAQPLNRYGVRTSTGAITVNLPDLNEVAYGDWIDMADVDFEAATNNITLSANGSQQISSFGVLAGSQTLNVSGVRVTLIATPTCWSMIV